MTFNPEGDEIIECIGGGKKEGFLITAILIGVVIVGASLLLRDLNVKEDNNKANIR